MAKESRQRNSGWLGAHSLVPREQIGDVEKDLRSLMKKCGDLTKELESRKIVEEEQKEKLLLEFIPVADALDAFAGDLLKGNVLSDLQKNELEMLGRRFTRAFERSSVSRLVIQLSETKLDATCHEVIRAEVREGTPDGTILEVVKPGYMFSGRVLRPAKVIVATCNEG